MKNVTDLIESLFSTEKERFWVTVYPNRANAAVLSPSSSGEDTTYHVGQLIDLTSLTLKRQLLAPFERSVSETFWNSISGHVIQAIAGPLFSYEDLNKRGEQNVRAYLVEPVLRELTKHLSGLSPSPSPGCSLFKATLSMEQAVRLHQGSGKPATADFLIVVRSSSDNKVLSVIPGEAKVNMETALQKYCKQLSKYMWKVATCEDNPKRTTVGVLIDHCTFRICFCPLMDSADHILPITFVTPPIRWRRHEVSQVAINPEALLLLSTCLTLLLDAEVPSQFPLEDMHVVNQVSAQLHKEPFVLSDASNTSDILKVIEDLKVMKETMKRLEERLMEKDGEIAILKQECRRISLLATPSPPRKKLRNTSEPPPPPPEF